MNTKMMIKFNPNEILEKLENLGIKRSYLSNPSSIYYIGYSNPTISKAFKNANIFIVYLLIFFIFSFIIYLLF